MPTALLTLENGVLKILRLLTLIITPLTFLGAWYVVPGILDATGLRFLSGVVTFLWGLEFYFFQRLSTISAVDTLSSSENNRLLLRLATLRKRVWWIGGMGLISALLLWFMTAMELPMTSPVYATMVGVLLGISLSYLILIPGWLNESQRFIDEIKRRDVLTKKRAEAVKLMTTDKK